MPGGVCVPVSVRGGEGIILIRKRTKVWKEVGNDLALQFPLLSTSSFESMPLADLKNIDLLQFSPQVRYTYHSSLCYSSIEYLPGKSLASSNEN